MKRIAIASGLAAALCATPGLCADPDPGARVNAKSVAVSAAAPSVAPSRVQLPELNGGVDADGRGFSGECASARSDLCYDYREGRLVYKPTRQWMPEVSGLKAEHISVRRDKVLFHYSFR